MPGRAARPPRPPVITGRWPVMAAASGAAAAVIVCVAALAARVLRAERAAGTIRAAAEPAVEQRKQPSRDVIGTWHGDRPPDAPALRGQPGRALPPVHGLLHAPGAARRPAWENAVLQQLASWPAGRRRIIRLLCQPARAGGGAPGQHRTSRAGQEIPLPVTQPGEGGFGEHGSAAVWPVGIGFPCRGRQVLRRRRAGSGLAGQRVTIAAHACSKVARWASLSRSKTSRAHRRDVLGRGGAMASAPAGVSSTKAPRPSAVHSCAAPDRGAPSGSADATAGSAPSSAPRRPGTGEAGARRLAELHEHLVLRQRQPAVLLQLPVEGGGKQRAHPQVGPPRPLLVFAEPPPVMRPA